MSVTDTFYAVDNWNTANFKNGIRISTNFDIKIESVVKYPNSASTTCYIQNAAHEVVDSASFSGNTATFTTQPTLTTGVAWYILVDDGANTVRHDMKGTVTDYPLAGTNINADSGWYSTIGDVTSNMDIYQATSTAQATGTNMQVNVDDTFKEVSNAFVNKDDAWKEVSAGTLNKDDSWKEVF